MESSYERYIGLVFDGRYRIEKIIGIGGMAVVFKAVDLLKHRNVAVKVLKDDVAADEASVQRFINESKAVSMLSHPNIVRIYDVSVTEERKYIVMEYIDGVTLKSLMNRRGPLSHEEILGFSEQILAALEHAHAKGIVHRDIKPQNIMVLPNGQIKVTDFGIAKLPNAETVTMSDKAIGTVYYISPEQASGRPIDARSDLYSTGILMYEMAAGKLPFNADNPVTVAMMQISDKAVPLSELGIKLPKGLEQIVALAMEKDPNDRYQSATQMLRHIRRLRENPHVSFLSSHRKQKPKVKKDKSQPIGGDSHSMLPIVLGVFVAFFVIAGACGLILLQRLMSTDSNKGYQEISVARFVGRYYSNELADYFASSDIYELGEVSYAYSADASAGYIISQTPEPNSTRKVYSGTQKCVVSLVISTGAETLKIDDYTICDYREVRTAITRSGLQYKIVWENSDTVQYGFVIRTSPVAGETVRINTEVVVYVSGGAAAGAIPVGSYVGMSEAEALLSLLASGLSVGDVMYAPSETVPAGCVISQSPDPLTNVVRNAPINFVVSSGTSPITMPEFIGQEPVAVRDMLGLLGFTTITTLEEYSTVAEGCVIRTDPPAGTECRPSDPVTVYVSLGTRYVMPGVVGQTREEAEAALTEAGIAYTVVTLVSDEIPAGVVISTDPAAGTELTGDSTVTVYVSEGTPGSEDTSDTREPIPMPNLVGWSLEDAMGVLEAVGLRLTGIDYTADDTVPAGFVASLSVPAGETVYAGDSVTLYISTGPAA